MLISTASDAFIIEITLSDYNLDEKNLYEATTVKLLESLNQFGLKFNGFISTIRF